MPNILHEMLSERACLLADGATGTNLFAMGLQTGESPELWNRDFPERIAKNYRLFIEAGSDIILTNSFGGNRYRLKLHGGAGELVELNKQAAAIARQEAAKVERTVIVAGSMGPTGEIMAPLGALSHQDAVSAFAEQACALAEGGADILWIETISSHEELRAALEGASVAGLPIVSTMSFDTNGRSMMGISPAELVGFVAQENHKPTAIGANCGVSPAELVMAILNMGPAMPADVLMVAKGNCGLPKYVDGAIEYDGTPELMSVYARMAVDAGAKIIGGCCGTTPAHITAMHKALEGYQAGEKPTMEQVVEELGEVSTGASAQYQGKTSIADGSALGGGGRKRRRNRK